MSVALSLQLVHNNLISLTELIEKMSINPAKILGLNIGIISGRPADITILDLNFPHTINSRRFKSLSRNTPFDGLNIKGKAVLTMVGGKILFEEI